MNHHLIMVEGFGWFQDLCWVQFGPGSKVPDGGHALAHGAQLKRKEYSEDFLKSTDMPTVEEAGSGGERDSSEIPKAVKKLLESSGVDWNSADGSHCARVPKRRVHPLVKHLTQEEQWCLCHCCENVDLKMKFSGGSLGHLGYLGHCCRLIVSCTTVARAWFSSLGEGFRFSGLRTSALFADDVIMLVSSSLYLGGLHPRVKWLP